jgi:hypothetical protein
MLQGSQIPTMSVLYNCYITKHEMRKEKNHSSHVNHPSVMKVVEVASDQSKLEFEIELQVKTIRALIKKLRPAERQRYYDGLLSHLLSQPVDYPETKRDKNDSFDYCNLSYQDLSLIRELSVKMHELYRISDSEMKS